MSNTEVRRIARAFGSEIVIDEPGLSGTLRRAATENGIPTITAEVGESQRFEKELVKSGLAGVLNVLYELGMLKGRPAQPIFQVIVKKTEWVRANKGGILEMIAEPRGLVFEGDELCTITNPFGKEVGRCGRPSRDGGGHHELSHGVAREPHMPSRQAGPDAFDRRSGPTQGARGECPARASEGGGGTGRSGSPEARPGGRRAGPGDGGGARKLGPGAGAPARDTFTADNEAARGEGEADDRPLKPEKETAKERKERNAQARRAAAAAAKRTSLPRERPTGSGTGFQAQRLLRGLRRGRRAGREGMNDVPSPAGSSG